MGKHQLRPTRSVSALIHGLLLIGFVSRVHLATIQPQLTESTISEVFTISVVNSTKPEGTKPGSDATYGIVINDTETTDFNRTTEAVEARTEDTKTTFPTGVPDLTSQESIHINDTTAASNGMSGSSTTPVEVGNTTFAEVYNQSVDLTISRDTTTSYVDVQSSKETAVGSLPTTAQSETETKNGSTLLQTTMAPSTYSTGKSDDKVTKLPAVMCHVCAGIGCGAAISDDVRDREVCRSTSGTCWMTYHVVSQTSERGCPSADATCESPWPIVRRENDRCQWCCIGQRCNNHVLSPHVCPSLSGCASVVNSRLTTLAFVSVAILLVHACQ